MSLITSIYEPFKEDIKNLKEEISREFKSKMRELGFKFAAEWIDYTLPILYRDVYIGYIENKSLYEIRFSAGTKQLVINDKIFTKFDTIEIPKIRVAKTVKGYKMDKTGQITKEKKYWNQSLKDHTYQDLLRKGKIELLLKSIGK